MQAAMQSVLDATVVRFKHSITRAAIISGILSADCCLYLYAFNWQLIAISLNENCKRLC